MALAEGFSLAGDVQHLFDQYINHVNLANLTRFNVFAVSGHKFICG